MMAVGLLILLLFIHMKALQADPSMLPVQGFVMDTDSGDPLEGTFSVTFNLYTHCDDEESVYTENQSLELTNGLYGTSLDVPLDIIKESDSLCLGMQFEEDSEMSPRLEYDAAPYARLAEEAEVAQVANVALSLDDSFLSTLVGSGLDVSGNTISLDTSTSQTWSGSQSYTQQVSLSADPSDTSSSNASFRINPATAGSNEKFLAIQNNGSDRFTVDAEGDVTITGSLSISGTLSGSGVGDITSVLPGEGLTGGGIIGAVSLSLDQDVDAVWTGNHTFSSSASFSSDLNMTVSDDEQFSLSALLDETDVNDVFSLSMTNATTSGSQRGIVVNNADSSGTTESLMALDNADTNTAVTSALTINNSGGGGFGTLLNTPSLDISGTGALSGATGLSSSGTIAFSDLASCSAVQTSSLGVLSCGTTSSGDITGVTAGTGLTGGGSSGDVTLNVDVGTTASKIVQLDSSSQLPAVSGANLTSLNATNISSGTLADARLSSNVSLIGGTIESSEITDDTISASDLGTDSVGASELSADAVGSSEISTDAVGSSEIAADAVGSSEISVDAVNSSEIVADAVGSSEITTDAIGSSEIEADAVGPSELASTTITAGSYSLASITVDADGRLTSASSGTASGDISAVGDAASGDAFTDGSNNGSKLIYEGSSIDSNETILTFTGNPSSLFTVTIPNTTGTLITTGDSNSVTGGMIDESSLVLTGLIDDDDLATGAVDGGSGGEIADNTITADDISADAVGASELTASIALSDGDFFDFSSIDASSSSEGIKLPQGTSVSSATADGQMAWDSDDDELKVGTGGSMVTVGSFLFYGTDTSNRTASYSIGSVGQEDQVVAMAMTCNNLRFQVDTAPATTASWTAVAQINSSNTSLTCTISGTSTTCSDTSNSTGSISAGDMIRLNITESATGASGTAGSSWSMVCYPN